MPDVTQFFKVRAAALPPNVRAIHALAHDHDAADLSYIAHVIARRTLRAVPRTTAAHAVGGAHDDR